MKKALIILLLISPAYSANLKSIEDGVREKQIEQCRERIDHYKERIRTGSIDWYEQYMLNRWRKRCAKYGIR